MINLWQTTEHIVIAMGMGIVGLQFSLAFNITILTMIIFAMLTLGSSILILQTYMKKSR